MAPQQKKTDQPQEKTYQFSEQDLIKLREGTRSVTSSKNDIKRPICGGIDVHKKVLMAAACVTDPETLSATFYVKEFTTSNYDIKLMAEWFKSYNVVDVCMESTGKYWIPVYNILEQNELKPILTHPKYVKQARGKKTDFRDAINIANLFRLDVVKPSFIPPFDIRDLRELCRYRLKLTYMRTSEKNRYQNSMTISKVRLDSVFRDPFGVSATHIMSYLLDTDPNDIDDNIILSMVDTRTKASPEKILDNIHGYEFVGVQKDKIKIIKKHIDEINELIKEVDDKLKHYQEKYADIVDRLAKIPGITPNSALYIIGEIGTDMSVWRDEKSLASWAGLSPASNESAKKKKSTKIGNGGHYLKPLLVQCLLAAIKSKNKQPYFYNKYIQIKKRRGHKKAIIAVCRKMLVSIYHMIKDGTEFHPVDYDQVVSTKNPKEKKPSLDSVINFLGEQGIDNDIIRMIESHCLKHDLEKMLAAQKPVSKKTSKKKQPKSDAKTESTEQKPAKRRGRPPKSSKKEVPSSDSSAVATA